MREKKKGLIIVQGDSFRLECVEVTGPLRYGERNKKA